MFTKKITDLFTADLLNAVSGVLGEAKKCKDCGCAKCTCDTEEDDDDAEDTQEGYIPTTRNLTARDNETIGKLSALMKKEREAKEKKEPLGVKTEETEVEENYVSDAQRKAVWANRADDGKGHPDKKKKMKEEAEDLDEAGLWANIHAKRERIKRGSGERMRKPGEKGAPTPEGIRSAQEEVEIHESAIFAKRVHNVAKHYGFTNVGTGKEKASISHNNGESIAHSHNGSMWVHSGKAGETIKSGSSKDDSLSRHLEGRGYKLKEEVQVDEVAPPGAKYERMIKHIKKAYAKDGKLTDKEKGIAYATAWKAKNEETEIEENWVVKKGTEVVSTHKSKDEADVKAMKHPLYKVYAKEEVEIEEAALKSNKDGSSGSRGTTFSSSSPNSYKVVNNKGEHLADALNMKDPKYGGRTTHWHVTWHKDRHKDHPTSFQYMHQLKKHIKGLDEEVEIEEAVGDITVKKLSPDEAFKKHTGQVTKKTSVPKDPRTGKTLYQKMTSEEVEELDEISSKTLGSYGKKAKKEAEARNDPMHRASGRLMASKKTNPARGGYKLTKVAATFGEEAELDEALDSMSDARIKYHATKNFPHGKYSSKEIDAEHKRRMKAVPNYHTVKASLSEEAEQIDELSKDTLKSYMDKKKVPSGAVVANVNDKNSMRKYTNRVVGGVRAAKRLMAKEEAEQIDEISREALGSYVVNAARDAGKRGVTAGLKIKDGEDSSKEFKKIKNREKGIDTAVSRLTQEEQEFIDSLNAMDLDEARGRPKKNAGKDFTVNPRTKEKLYHDNPEHMAKIERLQKNGVIAKPKTEASQHIINQLSKAKTSMRGGETIHFTHGESQHVSGTHAARLLDKYHGMKPDEKEAFQKKIGHSHAKLKSEL